MTTASKKSKGRNLQKLTCQGFFDIGCKYGLQDGDVTSRSMGCAGVDVILSPKAVEILGPLAIECKNCEALNVYSVFEHHANKYNKMLPLLVHKKNRRDPQVTMRWSDFLMLLGRSLPWHQNQ